MITKYYVYGSRVAGTKIELEAIFKSEKAASEYAKAEKDKVSVRPGMDFFYYIKPVLVEE